MTMELAIMFVPFILAMGLYCSNDPLTRRFMDDLTRGDEDA